VGQAAVNAGFQVAVSLGGHFLFKHILTTPSRLDWHSVFIDLKPKRSLVQIWRRQEVMSFARDIERRVNAGNGGSCRFTRLTIGFSKKLNKRIAAVAPHVCHCNGQHRLSSYRRRTWPAPEKRGRAHRARVSPRHVR
jgi:hypothetical protein